MPIYDTRSQNILFCKSLTASTEVMINNAEVLIRLLSLQSDYREHLIPFDHGS